MLFTRQVKNLRNFYLKRLFKSFSFIFLVLVAIGFFVVAPLWSYHRINREAVSFWGWIANKGHILINGQSFSDLAQKEIKDIWEIWWMPFFLANLIIFLMLQLSITSLVSVPISDSEDKTALIVSSPFGRKDLMIAKVSAFFIFYFITNFLLLFLPTLFYYLFSGGFTANWILEISFLVFWSSIFPFLCFLLFYPLIFCLELFRWGRSLLIILLAIFTNFFSYLREFPFVDKLISNFLHNPLLPIVLCPVIGGLFLFLYWKKYLKKEFT